MQCCVLGSLFVAKHFFCVYAKEIKILGKGKELDFFKGREESVKVRIFAL